MPASAAARSSDPSEWITTHDAAKELGVTPGRVRQYVLEGRLPATKSGRDLLIRRNDLNLIRERRTAGRPSAVVRA